MIRKIAAYFTQVMQRWLPDAFLLAIFLTFIVFACGIVFEQQSLDAMVGYWGDGLWNLLAFSMQVVLILVTGYVFVISEPVTKALHTLCDFAKTPSQAIVLTSALSMACFWLNGTFGLIASALIARHIAHQVKNVNFPLLVAMAYAGMLIWHAGLGGLIPLAISAPGDDALGALMQGRVVPVSETIFSLPVFLIVLALVTTVPLLGLWMMPQNDKQVSVRALETEQPLPQLDSITPAQKVENSRLLSLLLVGLGAWYLIRHFLAGGGLNLNIMILLFFTGGVFFHRTPINYLQAFYKSARIGSSIALQYPLYGGIMGMMASSGLAASVSEWFVAVSNAETFALYTFLSAGLVNFFIPSGGGQWAIQAPIVIPAADALSVPLNEAAMAVAFGDAWTNMIQPFWTLPLLAVAGLSSKDIMGYCVVVLFWSGIVIMTGLYFLF